MDLASCWFTGCYDILTSIYDSLFLTSNDKITYNGLRLCLWAVGTVGSIHCSQYILNNQFLLYIFSADILTFGCIVES